MAKKDAIDLDYVEQDTGTKHARDMERQKAQAEGNQNLQVTKALTAARKEGEQAMLDEAYNVKENSRLGCQIPITNDLDGLKVQLGPEAPVANFTNDDW